MNYKMSLGEKIFSAANLIVLGIIGLLTLYPFMYTLTMSVSTSAEASREGLHFLPGIVRIVRYEAKAHQADLDSHAAVEKANQKWCTENNVAYQPPSGFMTPRHWQVGGFMIYWHPDAVTGTAYQMVFRNPEVGRSYLVTISRTVVGTILTVLMTCIVAFPLSRKQMPGRKYVLWYILFTMLFSGGMIPAFLLMKGLGLYDNWLVYILPGLLSAFNIIIMKNFFQSIPESFAESAQLDGASDWTILFKIYMPLSKPVLATITLWTAVGHWNAWFDAMLYTSKPHLQVMQTVMQRIVIDGNAELIAKGLVNPNQMQFTDDSIKAATVIVTILPILILYPFVQKYFVKGIMLGGIKE